MSAAVVDNTVLTNFAIIQMPNLLKLAFGNVIIVQAVQEELAAGVSSGRVPEVDWSWLAATELTPIEKAKSEELSQTLGHGEAECIAVGLSRGYMVLTDDRNARRTAHAHNVKVSGTVGALLILIRQSALTITEADGYLDTMKQHSYRSPVKSLSELL
jgi:predicted nucleic acid-binding protein